MDSPHTQGLRPLCSCARQAQIRSAPLHTDHLYVIESDTLPQSDTQRFATSFLGGEARGERLDAIGSVATRGALGRCEDSCFEAGVAVGKRFRDSLGRNNIDADAKDHARYSSSNRTSSFRSATLRSECVGAVNKLRESSSP